MIRKARIEKDEVGRSATQWLCEISNNILNEL